ncbi:MAG: hypothetical protein HY735_04205 [Verrucomicrobia bacterium]|nr:hypothetical protein [Verrucomicrobiota bacterium]
MSITEIVLEKLSALPMEKQEQVLHYVEALSGDSSKISPMETEPYAWLRVASQMNLDGPPDWSERFEEYLQANASDAGR